MNFWNQGDDSAVDLAKQTTRAEKIFYRLTHLIPNNAPGPFEKKGGEPIGTGGLCVVNREHGSLDLLLCNYAIKNIQMFRGPYQTVQVIINCCRLLHVTSQD